MEGFLGIVLSSLILSMVQAISNSKPQTSSNSNSSIFISCNSSDPNFKCVQDEKCIALSRKCDGAIDCEDGTDETTCHKSCGAGWFQCADGHCIHGDWRCDGQHDCMGGDDSDEKDCEDAQPPPTVCNSVSEFRCSDGLCILKSWTCDGEPDCYGANDQGISDDESPALCGDMIKDASSCSGFLCNNTQCILQGWVCDGDNDCDDGSDEREDQCGVEHLGADHCSADQGMWSCADKSRCLSHTHLCDGVNQCSDASDEADWCQDESLSSCDKLECSKACMKTDKGAQCFCDKGYKLAEDGFSCVDIDECSLFGSCSQQCSNAEGSYSCSCQDGYIMDNATKSCITERGEPVLIFSAVNEIRALSVRSGMYTQVDINLPHAVGVGFDHLDTRVYWTDAAGGREGVMSKKLSAHTSDSLVVSGLDMPEQVAVDEYNKNIYLTESHLKQLVVCAMDGRGCSVLVTGLDKPRGVDIHHKTRQLFLSDWGAKPAIIRMNLDGSAMTNLVDTDLVWPNGLAVDQVMDRLYWADSKLDKIETVKIDGSDRREILTSHAIHPFSLTVFEDTLYWSDWEQREVVSCNKFTGKQYKVLVKEAGIRPMGVSVAHPVQSELHLAAPCTNHTCSHVCLPVASDQYTCVCPSHMVLDSDNGHTCVEDPLASKVFIAAGSSFYVTHPRVIGNMNMTFTSSIAPSSVGRLASVAQADQVFLTARGQPHTHVLAVNTTSGHVKRIITSDNIVDLAYDPRTNNLFWVDLHKSAVMVHSLVTSKTMELLISVDIPQSLLFVPEKNRLLIAHTDTLVMIYLPTKSVHKVIPQSLGHVSSMVYSANDNSVYMGDTKSKRILRLDLDTETISPFMENLNQGVTSLAVEDNILYWIEEFSSNLLWVPTNTTSKDVSWQDVGSIAGRDDAIRVVSFQPRVATEQTSSCHRSSCSHVCYNLDKDQGHVCKCPYGMTLDTRDNATCLSTCAGDTSVFHCGEGACIPMSWVCDGTPDCSQGEDEVDCKPETLAPASDSDRSGRVVNEDSKTSSSTESTTTSTSTVSTTTTVSTTATTTTASTSTTTATGEQEEETNELPPSDSSSEARSRSPNVKKVRSSSTKKNGGYIALSILLAVLAAMIISILYYKCKRNAKNDFSLSFTNATFNRSTPRPDSVVPRISEPDQELNAVTIVRRGNTTGYDNPGFDSPWARARRGQKLSTLEWPDSPNICSRDGIVCEGSSTPSKKFIKPLDTDSAYQEPSIAASSYTDIRHFSVGDEEDQDDTPFFPKDKQRLL